MTDRRGLAAGWLAYGLWGLFPLYFTALQPSGAWEVLAHRITWTFVVCLGVLLWRDELGTLVRSLRRPRLALGVGVAGYLIAINWGVYVFAVLTGRTNEAALGYFLNPLVTVALGVVVLREGLRPLQWAAVAIGAVAAGAYILYADVWLLPIAALIPVVEVLSVVIQVAYFKRTGKRVFRMSPIHHHFENIDTPWPETHISMRFWVITAVMTAVAWWLMGGRP